MASSVPDRVNHDPDHVLELQPPTVEPLLQNQLLLKITRPKPRLPVRSLRPRELRLVALINRERAAL